MPYIGNQGSIAGFVNQPSKQDLTGATGSTLTLTHAVSGPEDISLFINNVRQEPTTSYTATGTTVTLQGYTVAASDDIYVLYNGLTQLSSVPADGSVSDAKIIGMSASKLTGALPAIDGSNLTGLSGSNVKEVLAMLCDGQNYTVPSGTYTSTNVTTHQLLTTSYADVTGSSISYTPPSGTLAVIYNFIFEFIQGATQHGIGHFKFFIDSNEVVDGRQGMSAASMLNDQMNYKYVIPIGGSADTDTGRLASWTSAKTLKMQAREHSTSNSVELHRTYYWDGAATAKFRRPSLIITALG